MTEITIITLSGVEKRFGSFVAVSDLNLTLNEGEFFSLLGPSGCGKTTALRMIAGFQDPSAGTITIDGEPMEGVTANHRPTNMVFQSYAIFPHLNVGDNVAFGLYDMKLSRAEKRERVAQALEMVELGGMESRKADALSGGQRQRVALARALILRPKVLLLDEPLSALDKNLRHAMQFELRRLQQAIGITFVMVTHDQYEAMTMSDRIGVMFDGKLAQVDRPEVLYAKPCNRQVASFIGGMNFLPARMLSEAGNEMQIDAAGFGKLTIEANPNVIVRDRDMIVGIRPEQLEISATEPEDYNATAKGMVTDVAFYGESVQYFVTIDGVDTPVSVTVPNYFHTVDFKSGDSLWLGLQGASVIELGEDTN